MLRALVIWRVKSVSCCKIHHSYEACAISGNLVLPLAQSACLVILRSKRLAMCVNVKVSRGSMLVKWAANMWRSQIQGSDVLLAFFTNKYMPINNGLGFAAHHVNALSVIGTVQICVVKC